MRMLDQPRAMECAAAGAGEPPHAGAAVCHSPAVRTPSATGALGVGVPSPAFWAALRRMLEGIAGR